MLVSTHSTSASPYIGPLILSGPCGNWGLSFLIAELGIGSWGRLAVLFFLTIQSSATLVLSARRMKADQMSEIDIRNAWVALGGVVVHLNSAAILLMHDRWRCLPGIAITTPSTPLTAEERPGILARVVVTATILNCWYFRLHTRDMIGLTSNTYTRPSVASVPPSFMELPSFVWLAWPVILYHAQSERAIVILFVALFHSLGFPIEEVVKSEFTKWKDPLAENMYVF